MPVYDVTFSEGGRGSVQVDANTAEEAEQKAREFAREVHGLQTVHILKVEPIQEHINPG